MTFLKNLMTDRAKDSFTKAGRARNAQLKDKPVPPILSIAIDRLKFSTLIAMAAITYMVVTSAGSPKETPLSSPSSIYNSSHHIYQH